MEIAWMDVGLIAISILIGYLLARFISYLVGRQVEKRIDQTTGLLAQKIVFYTMLFLVMTVVLRELDVSFGALLAAGGLFGVALGFAAQTAVSNVISGLFLIFERPFNVSDVIRIDGSLGFVESIDLLSTKIRTFDNLYWRIPNEKLLKSDIYTITKYDIRRNDLVTSISYEDDISTAKDVLKECAENNAKVLAQPEPRILVKSMGESGIELTLRFWFERVDFLDVISELTQEVKVALEESGCTIPFPHRTVYIREEENWEEAQLLSEETAPPDEQSSPPESGDPS